jgi:hypothetical protein
MGRLWWTSHSSLALIVKGQPEGIAEGRKRPLGSIRFGGLEGNFVRCLGTSRPAETGPDPSRIITSPAARTVIRTLVV